MDHSLDTIVIIPQTKTVKSSNLKSKVIPRRMEGIHRNPDILNFPQRKTVVKETHSKLIY